MLDSRTAPAAGRHGRGIRTEGGMSTSDVTARGAEFARPATQTRPVTFPGDFATPTRVSRRDAHTHDRFWRDVRRRRLLAAADVAAAVAASASISTSPTTLIWALFLLPIWLVLAKLFCLYDRDQGSIRPLTLD